MKSSIKIIIPVALLVIVLAGAFLAYNNYKEDAANNNTTVINEEKTAKMTDFSFVDINNKEVKLSDFSGKGIVLNFWATWCPSCVSELPYFQSAYNNHKDIQFIMLNLTDGEKETEESVKKFISDNEYTFPVFMDKMAQGSKTYGVYLIPQTLFIDKDGKIIYTHSGAISEHNLETYIKSISE